MSKNLLNQIKEAIKHFILGNFSKTRESLNRYEILAHPTAIMALKEVDQLFCTGYFNFLNSLVKNDILAANTKHQKVYHIEECHCLRYAHSEVLVSNKIKRISPIITFGAKAYHFSQNTKYKKSVHGYNSE